ncbi:hypothetical protein NEF87_002692 [Candidatus Lokiarchaeum ossiferum]|uniref:Uncharacterized protein n=1 Tax=Candidatus Lokiarchaeum ossiferum TaxID=2951803 RepID=A0ABY6HU62_9ARCH|nr:hypothetical protein NEF87_002692 [Candidatus Lokiarchaeum sp. B-35]
MDLLSYILGLITIIIPYIIKKVIDRVFKKQEANNENIQDIFGQLKIIINVWKHREYVLMKASIIPDFNFCEDMMSSVQYLLDLLVKNDAINFRNKGNFDSNLKKLTHIPKKKKLESNEGWVKRIEKEMDEIIHNFEIYQKRNFISRKLFGY